MLRWPGGWLWVSACESLVSWWHQSCVCSPWQCYPLTCKWKKPCISPWKLHQQSQIHSMHKGDPVNTFECGNGEEPLVQGWGEAGASAELWLMPGAGAWLTWPWLMTSCVCLSHRALCLTSLGCEDKHLPSWATLWSPRLGRNGSEILRRKQSHRCEVSLPAAIKGFYHFLLLSSTWAEHKVTLVLF